MRVALLAYSIAWWLSLPLVALRLWLRGRKEPGYRLHWGERFGFYGEVPAFASGKPVLWVHAVSVGETRAAEPLIEVLLARYPHYVILLTHMTPTGRATGKALFEKHGDCLVQCYLPYDTGWMARRLLRRFSPRLCILMETEVWPNLIAQCERARIPVALVNARLSPRSLRRGLRFGALIKPAIGAMAAIGAQTDADARRLAELGARGTQITGSIKFDIEPPEEMVQVGRGFRSQIGERPVLLCASTRDGEEALILDALSRAGLGDTLLTIVPRHPQRFDEVAALLEVRGIAYMRRSALGGGALPAETGVLLGDTMGEMFAYYAACDLAFIGGSLLPLGGQNLIEACMLGKPVLLGPHTFNFAVVSEDAVVAGAALRVCDAAAMWDAALRLLADAESRAAMGRQAQDFARQHKGATERTVKLIAPLIN